MNEIGICIMEPLELDRILIEEFKYYHPELQDNTNEEVYDHPAYQEFLLDNYHIGKRCPFCNQTCVWTLDNVPELIDGQLTFYPPCCVQPAPAPAPPARRASR